MITESIIAYFAAIDTDSVFFDEHQPEDEESRHDKTTESASDVLVTNE